jgi:YegS/Rv2252/BmrU family lipid kinase
VSGSYLAVVNPAAGGGRCGKLWGPALEKLRAQGLEVEVGETRAPGDAARLAREAYARGVHRFLSVGGDGTAYEIVNGLFPQATDGERPTLAFLPLGTGNSFLRDFSERGAAHALEALQAGRRRPCDVLRLTYADGVLHYINLLSVGFAADVAMLRDRRFRALGPFGYLLGVFIRLVWLRHQSFPLRAEDEEQTDRRPCLFLSFNNSKFTGGTMMIAPRADTADGLIEYVRWGPIGRLGLVWNLRRLYDGTHIHHPLASRQATRKIEFSLERPVDVMVDGEVMTLQLQRLDVLPSALNVVV